MKNAKIEFTQQEANVVMQLIDIATKQAGLQVAESAVILARKFAEAFPADEPKEEPKKK